MLCSNCIEFHLRIHREKSNNRSHYEFRLSIYTIKQAEALYENTHCGTKINFSIATTKNMPFLKQIIWEHIWKYTAKQSYQFYPSGELSCNNHHMFYYLIFHFIPLCRILGLVITQTFTFSSLKMLSSPEVSILFSVQKQWYVT